MSQMPRYLGTTEQIHFCFKSDAPVLPENKVANDTGWRLACMPNMVELHRTIHHLVYRRTDDWRAVTCRGCMVSDTYKRAAGL